MRKYFKQYKQSVIIVGSVIDYLLIRTIIIFTKSENGIIYRARGIIPEESLLRNGSELRMKILAFLERYVLKHSAIVLSVSAKQRRHFIDKYGIYPHKVYVLHNYLNRWTYSHIEPSNNKNEIEIVYLGSYSKWQKIDKIFTLFNRLQDINPNIKFLICSNKKDINKFETKIRKDNVNNIEVDNFNYPKMIERIRKSTAGIILRDNCIINRVSSPFKIIDYFIAGLPIIMTDNIGDYKNLLKNKKFTFFIDNLDLSETELNRIMEFLKECHKDNKIPYRISRFINRKMSFDHELSYILRQLNKA
jgi:glycosyltransferase involved in cell wall biosynthesis